MTNCCTCRLGKINAYQSDLSDLPVLRRLLIEVGFWDIKREAERRYCAAQAAKAGVPADAPAVAARSDVASQAAPDVAPLGTQCSRGPSVPTAAAAAESDSGDESDSEDEPDAPVVPPPPAEAQVDFDESAHVRTEFVDAAARTSAGDGTMRATLQEVGLERRVCIRVGDHEGRSMEDAHRDRQVVRCAPAITAPVSLRVLGRGVVVDKVRVLAHCVRRCRAVARKLTRCSRSRRRWMCRPTWRGTF